MNEIALTLAQEVNHYRLVAKKYKRAKKIVDLCAGGSGFFSAAFSSANFGSALTGIGVLAAVPLGAIARAVRFTSAVIVTTGKKLDPKKQKHLEIVTLSLAKRDTVNRLLSKALVDNQVSDTEFQIIMDGFSQYNVLKDRPSGPNLLAIHLVKICLPKMLKT